MTLCCVVCKIRQRKRERGAETGKPAAEQQQALGERHKRNQRAQQVSKAENREGNIDYLLMGVCIPKAHLLTSGAAARTSKREHPPPRTRRPLSYRSTTHGCDAAEQVDGPFRFGIFGDEEKKESWTETHEVSRQRPLLPVIGIAPLPLFHKHLVLARSLTHLEGGRASAEQLPCSLCCVVVDKVKDKGDGECYYTNRVKGYLT